MSVRHHLVRWEDEYAARGLHFVEVSGGKTAELKLSKWRLARWAIKHPVLWDYENETAKAYEITGWPSTYLIGPDGKVFWQGNPAPLKSNKPLELAFRDLLERNLESAGVKAK